MFCCLYCRKQGSKIKNRKAKSKWKQVLPDDTDKGFSHQKSHEGFQGHLDFKSYNSDISTVTKQSWFFNWGFSGVKSDPRISLIKMCQLKKLIAV